MPKILLILPGLLFSLPAWAYLDPGTGSILLQSLIGILAIAGAAVGTFFGRIRAFLFHRRKTTDLGAHAVGTAAESHDK